MKSLERAYLGGLISKPIYLALRRNGVLTIEELKHFSPTQVQELRWVGAKRRLELEEFVRTLSQMPPSAEAPSDGDLRQEAVEVSNTELRDAVDRGRLSIHAYNSLIANGITTPEAARAVSVGRLSKLRGIGSKTALEIAEFLHLSAQSVAASNGDLAVDAVERDEGTSRGHPLESNYSGVETIAEALARRDISAPTFRKLLSHGIRTVNEISGLNGTQIATIFGEASKSRKQVMAVQGKTFSGGQVTPGDPAEPALSRLARICRRLLSPQEWIVLDRRQYETLQEIATRLGLSRERIRQVEAVAERKLRNVLLGELDLVTAWRTMLETPATAEHRLLAPYLDPEGDVNDQVCIAGSALRALGAQYARRFNGERLSGLWTMHPYRLTEVLVKLETALPCEGAEMRAAVLGLGLEPDLHLDNVLSDARSPIHYNEIIDAYVRSPGEDRDAAWLILQRRGRPQTIGDLADELRLPRHNLEEAMRRDKRFILVKPSHLWAISEWKLPETGYETTLDAVKGVLADLGPQRLSQLTRNVIARHPVTQAAVAQCLAHEDIGRWPDGRVDLVANGAPLVYESEPPPPQGVFPEQGGRILAILMPVTRDLLRGSGLGLPRYVSWALGLRQAPMEKAFSAANGRQIKVRRRIQGTSISTLRRFAEELGAAEDCALIVRLDTSSGTASVSLGCQNNCIHRSALGDRRTDEVC